jgi:EAL domain-containing protein (putative c-di-GMP-specific phosphodiesterase class I)
MPQSYESTKAALHSGAITLHYQPIHCLRSGELRGYEALARWGDLPPPRIAAIVEEHSLQSLWIEAQVTQINQALAILPPDIWISLNVDQSVLLLPKLPAILNRTPDPKRLVIEILEAVRIDDQVAEVLRELRCTHLLRADDIGAINYGWIDRIVGRYAELFDGLKLCRGLTYDVATNNRTAIFCAMMLAAAGEMGLSTVAEWVRWADQAAWLRDHGCQMGQGSLYGMPGPLQ